MSFETSNETSNLEQSNNFEICKNELLNFEFIIAHPYLLLRKISQNIEKNQMLQFYQYIINLRDIKLTSFMGICYLWNLYDIKEDVELNGLFDLFVECPGFNLYKHFTLAIQYILYKRYAISLIYLKKCERFLRHIIENTIDEQIIESQLYFVYSIYIYNTNELLKNKYLNKSCLVKHNIIKQNSFLYGMNTILNNALCHYNYNLIKKLCVQIIGIESEIENQIYFTKSIANFYLGVFYDKNEEEKDLQLAFEYYKKATETPIVPYINVQDIKNFKEPIYDFMAFTTLSNMYFESTTGTEQENYHNALRCLFLARKNCFNSTYKNSLGNRFLQLLDYAIENDTKIHIFDFIENNICENIALKEQNDYLVHRNALLEEENERYQIELGSIPGIGHLYQETFDHFQQQLQQFDHQFK